MIWVDSDDVDLTDRIMTVSMSHRGTRGVSVLVVLVLVLVVLVLVLVLVMRVLMGTVHFRPVKTHYVLGALGIVFDGQEESRRIEPRLADSHVEISLLPASLIGKVSQASSSKPGRNVRTWVRGGQVGSGMSSLRARLIRNRVRLCAKPIETASAAAGL